MRTRSRPSRTPSARGWRRGPRCSATPGETRPNIGSTAPPAPTSTPSPSSSRATPASAGAILSRNGSYMAYRRLEEHVGRFREFLAEHGETPGEQELIAAKLMGRWRSGAPLTLCPEEDDAAIGADLHRCNDFNYKTDDPHGYAVPLGSHIRRMNPRDTAA